MSFLYAYFGYHHIRMHPKDKDKMSFLLKNILFVTHEYTYQHLVNKILKDQLGTNMEAYIDDIVIKFIQPIGHVKDLEEMFGVIRRYEMRLNLKKCVFRVTLGKFLGYLIFVHGIGLFPNTPKHAYHSSSY